MRFATKDPDILQKVRLNPLLIAFEWGAGKKGSKRFGDRFAREVDIVVRGDALIGEAETIYYELKSWTASSLRRAKGESVPGPWIGARTGKLAQQFVRDTAMLELRNIRWIFDRRKMADKKKIIESFVEIIEQDVYLRKAWGTDSAATAVALDRVVAVF